MRWGDVTWSWNHCSRGSAIASFQSPPAQTRRESTGRRQCGRDGEGLSVERPIPAGSCPWKVDGGGAGLPSRDQSERMKTAKTRGDIIAHGCNHGSSHRSDDMGGRIRLVLRAVVIRRFGM
jgi:hypothetical protein